MEEFRFGDRRDLVDLNEEFYFYAVAIESQYFEPLDEKYITWCKENVDDNDWRPSMGNMGILFRTIEDQMAFKLRWT